MRFVLTAQKFSCPVSHSESLLNINLFAVVSCTKRKNFQVFPLFLLHSFNQVKICNKQKVMAPTPCFLMVIINNKRGKYYFLLWLCVWIPGPLDTSEPQWNYTHISFNKAQYFILLCNLLFSWERNSLITCVCAHFVAFPILLFIFIYIYYFLKYFIS